MHSATRQAGETVSTLPAARAEAAVVRKALVFSHRTARRTSSSPSDHGRSQS